MNSDTVIGPIARQVYLGKRNNNNSRFKMQVYQLQQKLVGLVVIVAE